MTLYTTCPHCGYKADATTSLADAPSTPEADDWALCIGCGRVALYMQAMIGLQLRIPTVAEQAEIDASPNIMRAREAWRRVTGADR